MIGCDGLEWKPEDSCDAAMCVVGLVRGQYRFSRIDPASDPKRLEICHCPAAGEMTQMRLPSDHSEELRDSLFLHRRACPPSIQRMVVRIDPHGKCIREAGCGVGRLQHLAGIERMEVGEIVPETLCGLDEHPFRRRRRHLRSLERGKVAESFLERVEQSLQCL